MDSLFDVLATWEEKATSVVGKALPCGHFIPEEVPEELLAEVVPFLLK
jgi:haloacetate dehalogenase